MLINYPLLKSLDPRWKSIKSIKKNIFLITSIYVEKKKLNALLWCQRTPLLLSKIYGPGVRCSGRRPRPYLTPGIISFTTLDLPYLRILSHENRFSWLISFWTSKYTIVGLSLSKYSSPTSLINTLNSLAVMKQYQ